MTRAPGIKILFLVPALSCQQTQGDDVPPADDDVGDDDTVADDDASDDDTTPDEGWVQISSGYNHSCARDALGSLTCWGTGHHLSDAPDVPFAWIGGGGEQHVCGVDDEGQVHCWGRNEVGQSNPP